MKKTLVLLAGLSAIATSAAASAAGAAAADSDAAQPADAAVVAASAAPEAYAAADADAAAIGGFADIVVTAQRRETLLQETPASITALSANTLGNAAITDVNDLARAAPGLVVSDQGPGTRRITLRGVRSAGEPQVAVYYDEAPIATTPGGSSDAGRNQGNLELFDLERLEILRGPQGTLYGASSMGGAIRLIYNKPSDRLEGAVDLIGSTTSHAAENYQANAMLNLPIAGDRLAIRGVYFRQQTSGWIYNFHTGADKTNKDVNEGGRILVLARPSDWLTLDLAAYFSDEKGRNPRWTPSEGHYVTSDWVNIPITDKDRLYNATAKVDLPFADLTVTGTYQARHGVFNYDNNYLLTDLAPDSPAYCLRHFDAATCATPEGMADFNAYVNSLLPMVYIYDSDVKNYAGEARLQSKDAGFIDWTVGAYWSYRNTWIHTHGQQVDGQGQLRDDVPLVYWRTTHDELRQVAGFGEISVHPTDSVTLTGGIRYYRYTRNVGGDTEKGFDLINFAQQDWVMRGTAQNGPLYKANLSWQATPDILVYAQAASGFRPGGANQVIGLPDEFTPYESDKLWTYEAGLKTMLIDRTLLFNLTGYWTEWTNMQVTGTPKSGQGGFLTNAGNARIRGVEAEAVANPTEGLEFTANVTLLSAKLTSDQETEFVVAQGRKGDRIPQVANIGLSLSGQYQWDIGRDLTALIRADYSYTGRSYTEFRPNSPINYQMGDYSLVGLRAGISKDQWGIFLFATNLFDVDAVTTAAPITHGQIETVTTAQPRTVGVNVKFGF